MEKVGLESCATLLFPSFFFLHTFLTGFFFSVSIARLFRRCAHLRMNEGHS